MDRESLCYVEMRERCAEDGYFDMLQDDGRLKCVCGALFEEGEGETVSSDPWAMPVCPSCFEGWMNDMKSTRQGGE